MFKIGDRVTIKSMTDEEFDKFDLEFGWRDEMDYYYHNSCVGKIIKIIKTGEEFNVRIRFVDGVAYWFSDYAIEKFEYDKNLLRTTKTCPTCKFYKDGDCIKTGFRVLENTVCKYNTTN